jgi:hypothetical protein
MVAATPETLKNPPTSDKVMLLVVRVEDAQHNVPAQAGMP